MNQLTNPLFIEDVDDTDTAAEAARSMAAEDAEHGASDMELTAGDVYDGLHEQLALARTRALMGERASALDALHTARADFETYRDALQGFPLHALEHAFTQTTQALCAEKMIEEMAENRGGEEMPLAFTPSAPFPQSATIETERKARSRKRASKAA